MAERRRTDRTDPTPSHVFKRTSAYDRAGGGISLKSRCPQRAWGFRPPSRHCCLRSRPANWAGGVTAAQKTADSGSRRPRAPFVLKTERGDGMSGRGWKLGPHPARTLRCQTAGVCVTWPRVLWGCVWLTNTTRITTTPTTTCGSQALGLSPANPNRNGEIASNAAAKKSMTR